MCADLEDLQRMFGNDTANFGDFSAAGEFKPDVAKTGEPQIQLRIVVNHTGGLYGESLNFGIREGCVINFFSGDSLNVDHKKTLACEYNTIAVRFENCDDRFIWNQHFGEIHW